MLKNDADIHLLVEECEFQPGTDQSRPSLVCVLPMVNRGAVDGMVTEFFCETFDYSTDPSGRISVAAASGNRQWRSDNYWPAIIVQGGERRPVRIKLDLQTDNELPGRIPEMLQVNLFYKTIGLSGIDWRVTELFITCEDWETSP